MDILRILVLSSMVLWYGCMNETQVKSAMVEVDGIEKLDRYWYQGKAEISVYNLEQNRYADVHPGKAIMIFVSEDFLTDIQVKNDRYKNSNSIPILKNNAIKKFTTGVYDYSTMTSVFTPADRSEHNHTLKVSASVQEWCGHTYQQLNLRDGKYTSTLHSYFEKEADKMASEDASLLEDEVMNLLRMSPTLIPTGEVNIIPSLENQRLKHLPLKSEKVNIGKGAYTEGEFEGESLRVINLTFKNGREKQIVYESENPYRIVGWKETDMSVFDGKPRITKATLSARELWPYWQQNSLEDTELRKKLGL